METRRPVDGQFGSECRTICNYCGVVAAWSRITWKLWAIFAFFKKRPLMVNFSKFCSESLHGDSDWDAVFKCRKICPTGNGWIVRYLPDKKAKIWLPLNCRYRADRARNLPGPAPNNVLTVLQISSQSVHFRRSNSRTRQHRFCHVEYFHDRLFEPIGPNDCLGMPCIYEKKLIISSPVGVWGIATSVCLSAW